MTIETCDIRQRLSFASVFINPAIKYPIAIIPRDAYDELRRQAMRMREELKLSEKEIARVVGVHDSKIIGCSRRNSMEGSTGLKSRPAAGAICRAETQTLV